MFKKIDKVILSSFLKVFFLMFLLVGFVLFMLNMVTVLEGLAGKNIGVYYYFLLVVYSTGSHSTLVILPISVLIGSILTYKSLQESRELVAIKSAGISIIRAFQPILILILFVSLMGLIGNSFLVPKSNLNLLNLIYNIRQVNPTINIKPGIFYNEIEGYSIKINKKAPDEKTIEEIIIYDHTHDRGNVMALMAKKGQIYLSDNKRYLIVDLVDGYSYLEKSIIDGETKDENDESISKFIRTHFETQRIVLDLEELDPNYNKNTYGNWTINKSTPVLFDEVNKWKEELQKYKDEIEQKFYELLPNLKNIIQNQDLIEPDIDEPEKKILKRIIKITSIKTLATELKNKIANVSKFKTRVYDIKWKIERLKYKIRRNLAQAHMHFALAFSTILIFFVGAPLGAMTTRGNSRLAAIVSAVLIGVYYFLSQIPVVSLAPEGKIHPILAAWLANIVVLPIALFFTERVIRDRSVIDPDSIYRLKKKIKRFFRKEKINK